MIKGMVELSAQGSSAAQEDSVLNLQNRKIFVIADGFGGPQAGVAAAQTACDSVKNFLVKEAGDLEATLPFVLKSYYSLAGNVLFNALIHANRSLKKRNKAKSVHERGGASVLAAYVDGDLLALANVGVCSAWLFRNGQPIELVTPRSYSRLLNPFKKSAQAGTQIPLMALGVSEDLEPEVYETRVHEGDWLMLHTGGLAVSSCFDELVAELSQAQLNRLSQNEVSQRVSEKMKTAPFESNASIS